MAFDLASATWNSGEAQVLICSASFVEEARNQDNGNRQGQKEVNMPMEGVGDRHAKKP